MSNVVTLNAAQEKRLLLTITGIQFSHILGFMIVMPLGPILMPGCYRFKRTGFTPDRWLVFPRLSKRGMTRQQILPSANQQGTSHRLQRDAYRHYRQQLFFIFFGLATLFLSR